MVLSCGLGHGGQARARAPVDSADTAPQGMDSIMAALELTPKQRQSLKASAHALKPVVLLGAQGLTNAALAEIDRALSAHELIKVKVPGDDRSERDAAFARIADQLSAAPVQSIGKLLVFFRPAPEEPPPPARAPTAASVRATRKSTGKRPVRRER